MSKSRTLITHLPLHPFPGMAGTPTALLPHPSPLLVLRMGSLTTQTLLTTLGSFPNPISASMHSEPRLNPLLQLWDMQLKPQPSSPISRPSRISLRDPELPGMHSRTRTPEYTVLDHYPTPMCLLGIHLLLLGEYPRLPSITPDCQEEIPCIRLNPSESRG